MQRVRMATLTGILFLGTAVPGAFARPDGGQAPGAAAAPPGAVQIGFEERVRTENWDNIIDHNDAAKDSRRQWRIRTRAWAKASLGDRLAFFVGLNNESKGQADPHLPLTLDEIVFEQLYADIRATDKLTARIGRQNLMKGDGFILFDGNSGDGSRSLYVNAAVLGYGFAPKATLEFIALSDPSRDDYLPVFNDKQKVLTEWDERLAGLYYTDTRLPKTDLQAYVLHKDEKNDYRTVTNRQYQPERSLQIFGARVAREVRPGWSVTGELAGERGTQASRDVRAWGGYLNVRHAFKHAWKPAVLLGYTGMSGDDPSTPAIEGWDPPLSRWPRWSELYIYSQVPEVGVAYWTNMGMWQAEATASPTSRLNLRGTFYHLGAFHPFPGSAAVFGKGTSRGDLVEARVDFVLQRSLKGHVLYERLVPGDFYAGKTPGYFFRVEMIYSLQKAFPLGHKAAANAPAAPKAGN